MVQGLLPSGMLALQSGVEQAVGILHGLQQAGALDTEGAPIGRVQAVTFEPVAFDFDAAADAAIGTGGADG